MSGDGMIAGGVLAIGGAGTVALAARSARPLVAEMIPTRTIDAAARLSDAVGVFEPNLQRSLGNIDNVANVLPNKLGMLDMIGLPRKVDMRVHRELLSTSRPLVQAATELRLSMKADAAGAASLGARAVRVGAVGVVGVAAAVIGASLVLASLFDS